MPGREASTLAGAKGNDPRMHSLRTAREAQVSRGTARGPKVYMSLQPEGQTRLAKFMSQHPKLTNSKLVIASGLSKTYLTRIKKGRRARDGKATMPSLQVMVAIVAGAIVVLNDSNITIGDLFRVHPNEREIQAARSRLTEHEAQNRRCRSGTLRGPEVPMSPRPENQGTRLAKFISQHPKLTSSKLRIGSGVSRTHLTQIKKGRRAGNGKGAMPSLQVMVAVVAAAIVVLKDPTITVGDLFRVHPNEREIRAARDRLAEYEAEPRSKT
jgi:transcriptional regulator with XRE-family HTH domain